MSLHMCCALLAASTEWRRALRAELASVEAAPAGTDAVGQVPDAVDASEADVRYGAVRDLDFDRLVGYLAAASRLEVTPPELKLLRFVAARLGIS